MDFRLQNKDLVCSQGGTPDTVTGVEELLQRVMIRLCVPRGRFAYNTQLGSRWEDLTVEQMEKLSGLEPFGEANPTPVFLFRRMEVWKERLVCCKIQPQFLQYMNFIDNLPKRC